MSPTYFDPNAPVVGPHDAGPNPSGRGQLSRPRGTALHDVLARRHRPSTIVGVWLGMVALVACGDDGVGGSAAGGGSPGSTTSSTTSSSAVSVSSSQVTGAASTSTASASASSGTGASFQNLTELDLGTYDSAGTFKEFEIPEDTLGFFLLTDGKPNEGIGIAQLRLKGQPDIVTGYHLAGRSGTEIAQLESIATSNPATDLPTAMPVSAGTWQVRVVSNAADPNVSTRVYVRRTEDGAFHGGMLDLNVRVTPGAVDQAYLESVIDNLFATYYEPLIGISKGTVTFSSAPSEYSTVDDIDEFYALCKSPEDTAPTPSVNLFIVGDLFPGSGLLGYSNIAGSATNHGRTTSGLAIKLEGFLDQDVKVLVHELGHFAGLYHTAETDLSNVDQLDDTPACENFASWTSCPDLHNVMFPYIIGQEDFTPKQVAVIRGSAIYRGIFTEGGPVSDPLTPGNPAALPPPSWSNTSIATQASVPRSPVEALLDAHACGNAGDPLLAISRSLGASDFVELERIVADAAASPRVRARALSLLARFGDARAQRLVLTRAEAWAISSTTPRTMRLSAIHALRQGAPTRLAVLAPRLNADADLVVRAAAR